MSTKNGRFGNPEKRRLTDPRKASGGAIIGGTPHGIGDALLDMSKVVLMEDFTVTEVVVARQGAWQQNTWFQVIGGRINKTSDQVTIGLLTNTDGIAAQLTELLSMAHRAGPDLLDDTTRRLTALHQQKNVDLYWLKAAVENAIEAQEETAD